MDEKDRELQELRRQVESIKVEPVRRGQWLEGTRTVRVYACSVCGYGYSWGGFFAVEEWPFCPHCGIRMEGEA